MSISVGISTKGIVDYNIGGSTAVIAAFAYNFSLGYGRLAEGLSVVNAGTYDANNGGNGNLCGTNGTNSSVLAESRVAFSGIYSTFFSEVDALSVFTCLIL